MLRTCIAVSFTLEDSASASSREVLKSITQSSTFEIERSQAESRVSRSGMSLIVSQAFLRSERTRLVDERPFSTTGVADVGLDGADGEEAVGVAALRLKAKRLVGADAARPLSRAFSKLAICCDRRQ
jgi:hypothetical protein